MSSSLKNIKISDSYPRLVQQVDGIFYDGAGNRIQGIGGPQGTRGPQGIGSGSLGAQGPQGFQGILGATGSGVQGFQGPTGTDGTNGTDALWNFMNEWSGGVIYDTGDVVTYAGQTWYCLRYTVAGAGPFGGYIEGPTPYWQLLAAKGLTGATGSPGIGSSSVWNASEEPEVPGNFWVVEPAPGPGQASVQINVIDSYGIDQTSMLTALSGLVGTNMPIVFTITNGALTLSILVTSSLPSDLVGTWLITGDIITQNTLNGPSLYTVTYNMLGEFGATGGIKFPFLLGNQRTGSGNNLQFEKLATFQKIISTQNGTESYPTVERLVISGGDSYKNGPNYSGEGGDIYLWAGKGQDGGDIKVDAGNGISSGGTVKVRGGYTETGAGGFVEILAGQSNNGSGGNVSITSGYGSTGGGDISIRASGGGSTNGNISLYTASSLWAFRDNVLKFPDNSEQTTAYPGIPTSISSGNSAPGSAVVANPTNVVVNFSDGVGTAWSFDPTSITLKNLSMIKAGQYSILTEGGISRICSFGFEDLWQGGIRYIFDTNGHIREATNCLNIIPDSSFNYSKRFKVGSRWILDNGDLYECTYNGSGIDENAEWRFVPKTNYKVFTALVTQIGSNNNENISGVSLTVGVSYQIVDDGESVGFDFTNVGAPNNEFSTWFIATGTTPNSWGIPGFEAQLFHDYGAPEVTILENTIGNIWFRYEEEGRYICLSSDLFVPNKTIISMDAYGQDGNPECSLTYKALDTNKFRIDTFKTQYIDDALINSRLEIKVYY